MSYFVYNREKTWKKQETNIIIKMAKKKAANYYIENKVLRENARNKYKNSSEKEKDKKRVSKKQNIDLNERLKKRYQRNYNNSKIDKSSIIFLHNIKWVKRP